MYKTDVSELIDKVKDAEIQQLLADFKKVHGELLPKYKKGHQVFSGN